MEKDTTTQDPKKALYHREIRIRRVSDDNRMYIKNIAAKIGLTVNDFMKMKINEIVTSYPDHYKKPMLND